MNAYVRVEFFLYRENKNSNNKLFTWATEIVGPNNVLQVVVGNEANLKADGKEIEEVHENIFWSSCCVHTLSLFFIDLVNEF